MNKFEKYTRIAMLCVGVTAVGCKHQPVSDDAPQPRVNTKISVVHTEQTEDALRLPGRIEADPDHIVHIYAPLSGRLLNMKLVPGQEVRKGQAVALLQSGDVAQARADFEKAHIEVLRADRSFERAKLLASHEVMSLADLQELEAVDSAARSEQERARQRIHELGFSEAGTSDTTAITSPITGTVLEIGTAAGEMQRSLETSPGIATVANLDTVWVTGDLFEQDLGSVHLHDGVIVTFAAYPGEIFRATIANIGDSFDPATHAVKIRAILANPGHRFKPQMFATLQIFRPGVIRILLPKAAVLHDGDATEVYVPSGAGKYSLRRVTVGTSVGDKVEIKAGLNDGDQVVTEGAAFLREPVAD